MDAKKGIKLSDVNNLPPGHRATWELRTKIAVAKLGSKLTSGTTSAAFPRILKQQAATTADDDFVEVHIYGPMTRRTLESVTVLDGRSKAKRVIVKALQEKLNPIGVPVLVK